MEHRQLGRTGVSVSKLCLGAMMFGSWGNPDHDESIKALAGGRRDDVILATKFHSNPAFEPAARRR